MNTFESWFNNQQYTNPPVNEFHKRLMLAAWRAAVFHAISECELISNRMYPSMVSEQAENVGYQLREMLK